LEVKDSNLVKAYIAVKILTSHFIKCRYIFQKHGNEPWRQSLTLADEHICSGMGENYDGNKNSYFFFQLLSEIQQI
jgi:hypothetical protein